MTWTPPRGRLSRGPLQSGRRNLLGVIRVGIRMIVQSALPVEKLTAPSGKFSASAGGKICT